ncbi:HAD family hydrolase [Xanthomonas citri]|nr:HAD family hydrolase [Xanthomonas citri]
MPEDYASGGFAATRHRRSEPSPIAADRPDGITSFYERLLKASNSCPSAMLVRAIIRPRPMTLTTRLVIFDCDGVLVDSEPLSCAVLAQALQRQGIATTADQVQHDFLGRSVAAVRQQAQAQGVRLADDFETSLSTELLARFQTHLQPVDGIAALLETLELPTCVASSSHLQRVRLCLRTTGLAHHFDSRIYTAEMVARGKPAPDLFLLAASRMQIPAEACLVIEDSPSGVQAACAAAMPVWGFTGGSHHAASDSAATLLVSAGASRVFTDMAEMSAALRSAGTSAPALR